MSTLSEVFSYQAFVHAVAGTCGGFLAMSLFYPLDNLRTFLQVDNSERGNVETMVKLVQEDGIGILYRGLGPVLFSLGCSNFVYFYTNNMMKALYRSYVGAGKRADIPISVNLFIASFAGIVNVYTTCPLWVANTRLKLQRNKGDGKPYTGLFNALTRIINEEGFTTLWSGSTASVILVSNPTIHFVVYDKVKSYFVENALKTGRKHLTNLEIFNVGAIAKAVATVLTYPIQISQTRMRAHSGKQKKADDQEHYANTLDCLIKMFARDGFLGWYKGLFVKLFQTVLTAAFQFLAYERIAQLIFSLMGGGKGKISGGH